MYDSTDDYYLKKGGVFGMFKNHVMKRKINMSSINLLPINKNLIGSRNLPVLN